MHERRDEMKEKYAGITGHIPSLEDHGHLYMYYGLPHSDDCYVYGDGEDDEYLIQSYEGDDFCRKVAETFEYEYKWLDVLDEHNIELSRIFDVDVESLDLDVTASLLLYLVVSITYEDIFIDAIENGYLLRLVKRLQHWN